LIYLFLDLSSSATVVYRTHQAALHARSKLHGFEYPIGERLIVKLSTEMKSFPSLEGASSQLQSQQNFFNSSNNGANFCSVSLPSPQSLAPSQAQCAQRCFIVCSPHALPIHVLKKVFCRFGNLIDVYLLNNRNCGYVKYATNESARQVNIMCQTLCDMFRVINQFNRKWQHKNYNFFLLLKHNSNRQ
jgi:hypothetical protein